MTLDVGKMTTVYQEGVLGTSHVRTSWVMAGDAYMTMTVHQITVPFTGQVFIALQEHSSLLGL